MALLGLQNGESVRLLLLGYAWFVSKIFSENALHEQLTSRLTFNLSYDFIVIGSGASGSVVASRLSENPSVTVLLLEEGGPESIVTDIPAMDLLNLIQPSRFTALFPFEPQKNACLAFTNHQYNYPVHRCLGGGTSVNGMFYNRGGKNDYDNWSQNFHLAGWSYEEVLPYFKKSENNQDPLYYQNSKFHARGGPLTVSTPKLEEATPNYKLLTETILAGAAELGYPPTDINGDNQIGSVIPQRTVDGGDGKRMTTSKAFLQPAKNRPNLHILANAQVTKIIFDDQKKAEAVEFIHRPNLEISNHAVVRARREIVVSGGAIMSPKLLLLSGLGPAKHLAELGIDLVADLPVGQNFHDHVRVAGLDFTVNVTMFKFWMDLINLPNLHNFYRYGGGPLANTFYIHKGAFINVRSSVPGDDGDLFGPADTLIAPWVIGESFPVFGTSHPTFRGDILFNYYGPHLVQSTLSFFATLNYVKSRGSVRLKSSDPLEPPSIDPNYLSHPQDVQRLIEIFRLTRALRKTTAFTKIGAQLFREVVPGCEKFLGAGVTPDSDDVSDAYVECVIRTFTLTETHPAGTCKMAAQGDPTGVVDHRLRVRGGVKGLRVIDASIMPQSVTGNLMAPCIMIGEKGADMIKEDNGDLFMKL